MLLLPGLHLRNLGGEYEFKEDTTPGLLFQDWRKLIQLCKTDDLEIDKLCDLFNSRMQIYCQNKHSLVLETTGDEVNTVNIEDTG